jgi:SagB-type dehydrogenase family enzyme
MTDHVQEFHRRTSYERGKTAGPPLDWANEPDAFKIYPGLETISLVPPANGPEDYVSDLLGENLQFDHHFEMDFAKLSRILNNTHAMTAKARYKDKDFFYRSIASAGALYPFELYVGATNIAGLDDGIYHHAVGLQSLAVLGKGSILPELARGVQLSEATRPTAVFFITAIFFRSAWKYRTRAYRYHLLDSGHMLENLTLALKAMRAPYTLYYDFDDTVINQLLGLDPKREVCLAIACALGKDYESQIQEEPAKIPHEARRASQVAHVEIDYPAIRKMHRLSTPILDTMDQPEMIDHLGLKPLQQTKIMLPEKWPELVTYPEAVFRRRSLRNFVRGELKAEIFTGFLKILCSEDSSREDAPSGLNKSIAVGFLANESTGLEPGFYLLDRKAAAVSLVAPGLFMERMAHICLDQEWLANCSIHMLFMANLQVLNETRGPRGYRHAFLASGRLGQRLYVGAASMRIGCCGIGAFYDYEASELLGLNSASKLLYLVGIGPVKKYASL